MKSNISSEVSRPTRRELDFAKVRYSEFRVSPAVNGRARGQAAVAASRFLGRRWVKNTQICIRLGG